MAQEADTSVFEEVYIDKVRHMFSTLSSVQEEWVWIRNHFEGVPLVITMEDYEEARNQHTAGERDYPHSLHFELSDAVYHFQSFTSGYYGSSVQSLKYVLQQFGLELTESFFVNHKSFEIDLEQRQIRTPDFNYELDNKVLENTQSLEVMEVITVRAGYDSLEQLMAWDEDESGSILREVLEVGVALFRKAREGGDAESQEIIKRLRNLPETRYAVTGT